MNFILILKVNLALGTFSNMVIPTEVVASISHFPSAVFNKQYKNETWFAIRNQHESTEKATDFTMILNKAQLPTQPCL